MYDSLLDVDTSENKATVVFLLNEMRDAIKNGKPTKPVMKMYDEYFEKQGLIKTPFGRMTQEKWQEMRDRHIVVYEDGGWKIGNQKYKVTDAATGKITEHNLADKWL